MKYKNYFDLFGIPIIYSLDKKALHKKYLQLSQRYHPDKSDLLNSNNLMSEIISGYNILNKDLSRAEYILQLQKVDFLVNNDEIIMEIFILNEQLDNINQKDQLIQFKEEINKKYNLSLSSFDKYYLIDQNKTIKALQYAKYYFQIINLISDKIKNI